MAIHIRRREFMFTLGSAAAALPLAARAQQGDRMRRIGVLMGFAESDREGQAFVAAFREGLQKLGWVEGRNIQIDARWAAGDTGLMQQFAKKLVALQPDLILYPGPGQVRVGDQPQERVWSRCPRQLEY